MSVRDEAEARHPTSDAKRQANRDAAWAYWEKVAERQGGTLVALDVDEYGLVKSVTIETQHAD